MATSTIDLVNTAKYSFLGFGTHTPFCEKGSPLTNYAGDLSTSQFNSLVDNVLSYFSCMRTSTNGADLSREGPSQTNSYPAKSQASLFAQMNSRGWGWRWIASPQSAPSQYMVSNSPLTLRPDTTDLVSGTNPMTPQAFDSSTAGWQAWLDSIYAGISQLESLGCGVEIVTSPNECGDTNAVPNYWFVGLTQAQYLSFVQTVINGTGMSGGQGLLAKKPYLKFLLDDPVAATYAYRTGVLGNAPAKAACTYYGFHIYNDGMSGNQDFGITTDTSIFGQVATVEAGWFVNKTLASLVAVDIKPPVHTIHNTIAYGRAPFVLNWTVLRDHTAKGVANSQGVSYTAKALCDLNTAGHTYSLTPYWYAWKPYLVACGRGTASAYCAASLTSKDTDTNFTLGTGRYVNAFIRGTDGKYCFVYANFSGSTQSDTIAFTSGGSGISLSGNKTTYATIAKTETNNGAVSGTSVTLTSVPDGSIVLLEMS